MKIAQEDEYRSLTPRSLRKIEGFLKKSWWMLCIFLFSYLAYEQGLRSYADEYNQLYSRLVRLTREKEHAVEQQNNYLLQINSQSDPAWIEMTLMKGLGLVPEEQTKIFFTDSLLQNSG